MASTSRGVSCADREPVAVVVAAPRRPQQVGVVALQVGQVALHRVPVALDAAAGRRSGATRSTARSPRRRPTPARRRARARAAARRRSTRPRATARRARRRPTWSRTRLTSMFSVAVGMNTCASASQPSRSSRCGQSVGTEMKLPRWPQLMFRHSWLTRSSEHSNQPLRGVSEWTTRPVMVGRLGEARDLDVAEAVEGEARLVGLRPAAAQHVGVELPRGAEVLEVQGAVVLEHLGEAQLHLASRARPPRRGGPSRPCSGRGRRRRSPGALGDRDRAAAPP